MSIWAATWVVQKESWQNLWQLEVSETRDIFVSSTPTSDSPHSRDSKNVCLSEWSYIFTITSCPHSIKGHPTQVSQGPSPFIGGSVLHSHLLSQILGPPLLFIFQFRTFNSKGIWGSVVHFEDGKCMMMNYNLICYRVEISWNISCFLNQQTQKMV